MLNEEHALSLQAPVTDSLIFNTIKGMKKNKAPGPYGFNAEFFIATALRGLVFVRLFDISLLPMQCFQVLTLLL